MTIPHLTPAELKQRLQDPSTAPLLLDVREQAEFEHCHIQGSIWIPMGSVPARLEELPADRPIICICHHGGRSLQVASFLASRGFENVINLTGGVHRWAQDVEPSMPTY